VLSAVQNLTLLFPFVNRNSGIWKMERLLSSEELAHLLNLSVATVRRLAKAGKIPHVRIGHLYRFNLQEVLAYIKNRGKNEAAENNPPV